MKHSAVLDIECGYCGRTALAQVRSELVAVPGQPLPRWTIVLPDSWDTMPYVGTRPEYQGCDAIVCGTCIAVEGERQ